MPALVVTAGVAGSALALPLLAATGASAAETSTWDKVAECESGGTWSANFGSGAYGGLQFTQEQWQNAGGLDFAERADLASRSQQIAVAERVLASQGPQAWPLCGVPAGLTQEAPAAAVDPGLPKGTASPSPAPSRPDDSIPYLGTGTPSTDFGAPTPGSPSPAASPSFLLPDYPLGAPSGLPVMPDPVLPETPPGLPGDPTAPTSPTAPTPPSTDPEQPADPSVPADPTAPVAPSDPASPTAPVAPVGPADPSAPADPAAPGAPAAGAAQSGGKHRGPAAVEAPVTSDAASDPTYTVKAGDSLAAIADANGVKGGWNALYEANEQVIGGDADLIKPGQNLDLTDE
ncbi:MULTISPECIES: transglycosylase family protein [unclassified Streptomyces]|uniref:LysM peptidoglycan-binding domain-containing protein n=1 Tax=unclassified Streptomyces TaxID=2593676 RepID=UPI0031B9C277